ncbi:DUF1801 domain-containing protein [Yoonia sp. 2307UL14-13]|uniref:DUF1801 domain-containing protein n=1 Tax=Yoonia sp. 2307UL14-13 TaxID=3126506 RepID=UPI0030A0785C
MADNKTQATTESVTEFIAAVDNPTRRQDAETLDRLFRDITGWHPRMWGPTIIGYGQYDYTYESGRSGTFLATGFSPRKANMVLYIMPGYAEFGDILDRLGKHRLGKSCLYINKLADVDIGVVAEIVRAGLNDLGERWPVSGT